MTCNAIKFFIKFRQLCILVVGAVGGRFDHEMGNINVLCLFKDIRVILISDDCIIHLLPGDRHHQIQILHSVAGPHCGLIPIGLPSRSTTTTGLQWDLSALFHQTLMLAHVFSDKALHDSYFAYQTCLFVSDLSFPPYVSHNGFHHPN